MNGYFMTVVKVGKKVQAELAMLYSMQPCGRQWEFSENRPKQIANCAPEKKEKEKEEQEAKDIRESERIEKEDSAELS